MKKLMVFLVCTLVLNLVRMSPAMAMEHVVADDIITEDIIIDVSALACERVDSIENVQTSPYATTSFDWSISAGKIKKNSNRYPMLKNETITMEATFTPRDCDVDFGLIAPDGRFYYSSGSNGQIDQTIRVDQDGDYYLAVRNNSDKTVDAKGIVYY